jgi:hypothetical protein
MTGKDFVAEGRTLEWLGLSGMDLPQIRRVVDEGFEVAGRMVDFVVSPGTPA